MQLAAAGHQVTSLDASQNRLARLRENLDRTHLGAELVRADALTWDPWRDFAAILLDAPCSATGTFRRHPEVLYRARPPIIAASSDTQRRLLDRAAHWVRPGGTLVYSVCSLEPEEGEQVIAAFLEGRSDFTIAPGDLPPFAAPSAEGWVRLLPGVLEDQGGLDGFFMARLVRTA
jgi:16S rRNA (cytosine967-C5)-methyltransferase